MKNGVSKGPAPKNHQKVAAETDSSKFTTKKTFVVAPYWQQVSDKVKRKFSNYGISTCFKSHQTLRQFVVAPKDKTKVKEQSGVVYRISSGGVIKLTGVKQREHWENVLKNILLILRTISPRPLNTIKKRSQARSG